MTTMSEVRNNNNNNNQEKRYSVTKITARRGWAIDQIRFEYRYIATLNQKDIQPKTSSDGRAWSVGVDGGRKDGREFKLTKGEHLVRVTHERLKQRFFL